MSEGNVLSMRLELIQRIHSFTTGPEASGNTCMANWRKYFSADATDEEHSVLELPGKPVTGSPSILKGYHTALIDGSPSIIVSPVG